MVGRTRPPCQPYPCQHVSWQLYPCHPGVEQWQHIILKSRYYIAPCGFGRICHLIQLCSRCVQKGSYIKRNMRMHFIQQYGFTLYKKKSQKAKPQRWKQGNNEALKIITIHHDTYSYQLGLWRCQQSKVIWMEWEYYGKRQHTSLFLSSAW